MLSHCGTPWVAFRNLPKVNCIIELTLKEKEYIKKVERLFAVPHIFLF
jgi:hypothetical protein